MYSNDLLREIDGILIKIAEKPFDCICFEFTEFVRLERSDLLKGAWNLFDLSSCSTNPEFNVSGVFSVHRAYQNQGK